MKRKSFLMLATALVLGAGVVYGAGVAMAQMPGPMGGRGGAAVYDPAEHRLVSCIELKAEVVLSLVDEIQDAG